MNGIATNASPPDSMAVWPLAAYFGLVVLTAVGMLAISHVLGQHHKDRATGTPYESGMLPTGTARLRFPADFYLIAMFFLIFDMESIFIFAWAVSMRDTGWTGYTEMLIFVAVLIAALMYLWGVGALDWRTAPTTAPRRCGAEGGTPA